MKETQLQPLTITIKDSFAQRGITYSSPTTITAVINIPDTVENNNTKISCAAFLLGGTEFSVGVYDVCRSVSVYALMSV